MKAMIYAVLSQRDERVASAVVSPRGVCRTVLSQVFQRVVCSRCRAPHPARPHWVETAFHSAAGTALKGWRISLQAHGWDFFVLCRITCHRMWEGGFRRAIWRRTAVDMLQAGLLDGVFFRASRLTLLAFLNGLQRRRDHGGSNGLLLHRWGQRAATNVMVFAE